MNILDEIFSSISHGFGILFALFAIIIPFIQTSDFLPLLSLEIFGFSLFFTYLFSTLFHSLSFTKAKTVFQILDHCSIFILIAGSYSSFILFKLRTPLGFFLILVIWCVAITGIVLKSVFYKNNKHFFLLTYILLGWIGILCIGQLLNHASQHTIQLLLLGGIFYTGGISFYKVKFPFHHTIWHVCVLLGSITHFFALYS